MYFNDSVCLLIPYDRNKIIGVISFISPLENIEKYPNLFQSPLSRGVGGTSQGSIDLINDHVTENKVNFQVGWDRLWSNLEKYGLLHA